MTALSQSTRRKLSLPKLAEELGNVSRACQLMGYHRDSFYEIRRAFQVGGVSALVEQRRWPRGPHPNRVAPEIEQKILDYALERPSARLSAPTSCACRMSTSALRAYAGSGCGTSCRR